jgi:thioesterase domain-containing protein
MKDKTMAPDLTNLSAEQKRELLAQLLRTREATPVEVPLSQGQRRLWDLQSLDPSSPVYNISIQYDLDGPLDTEALKRAVAAVVGRHPALRTSFKSSKGKPVQVVMPSGAADLKIVDLSSLDPRDWRAEAERVAHADAAAPFDLSADPPRRLTLVRRSARENSLIVTIHHIICDRWSLGILASELSALYEAFATDCAEPALDPPGNYADFVACEHELINSQAFVNAIEAWESHMGQGLPAISLPNSERTATGYRGAREAIAFDESLARDLRALALDQEVTFYAVLLAGFAGFLRLETAQEELVLCSPVSGRHRPVSRGVIGYFNNIVPLRLDASGTPSFRELIGRVARESKSAFERQDVPLQRIADLPGLSRTPLSRCLFSLQNTRSLALRLPGVTSVYRDVPTGAANFDFSLFLEEKPEGILVLADYKAGAFKAEAVRRLVDGYQKALRNFVSDPDRPLFESQSAPKTTSASGGPGSQSAGLPLSELERRLIQLWEQALGTRPVGREDNYFDLGGHSLGAARMVARVEEMIGRPLPLAMILEAPTVEKFAALIASEGWAPCWSSLVPLRPEGSRPPFYCVHGGGGGVISYRRVVGYLHPDQPFWGLQARADAIPATARVEEIAAQYLAAVRVHQPEGPYYLGGHSFGALVAFEMAQQLKAEGQDVALLAIIDYAGPSARVTWKDRLRWNMIILSQLEWPDRWRHVRSLIDWRLRADPRIPNPARKFYLRVKKWSSPTLASRRLETLRSSLTALAQYQIRPYAGTITLIRALQGSPAIHTDPCGGWADTAEKVEVVDVPGDHMTLFHEPQVKTLAEAIQGLLDRAQSPR